MYMRARKSAPERLVCRLAQAERERDSAPIPLASTALTVCSQDACSTQTSVLSPLMQVRWAEREGSAWRRVGRKSRTSFSASAATWIVGRTMFAPTTSTHGQAGSQNTPARSVCAAVLHVHQRGCSASRSRHQSPKIPWIRTPSDTRRS